MSEPLKDMEKETITKFSNEIISNEIKPEQKNAEDKVKDFVQDKFFQKGNIWLKVRQILINLGFFIILLVPVMILFNSLATDKLWKILYSWGYADGFQLSNYLASTIFLAFIFVLVCSLAFLFRNNHREQKLYPKKKTYNQEKLEGRKKILNDMYTERFGDQDFRENTKYYAVEGEQNIPDRMIQDLFKEGGVEIK